MNVNISKCLFLAQNASSGLCFVASSAIVLCDTSRNLLRDYSVSDFFRSNVQLFGQLSVNNFELMLIKYQNSRRKGIQKKLEIRRWWWKFI